MSQTLVGLLVSENIITQEQLRAVLGAETSPSEASIEKLISAKVLDEERLTEFLSRHYSTPIMKVTHIDPDARTSILPLRSSIASAFLSVSRETRFLSLLPTQRERKSLHAL